MRNKLSFLFIIFFLGTYNRSSLVKIPPYSEKSVEIEYFPSILSNRPAIEYVCDEQRDSRAIPKTVETTEIVFRHPEIGNWKYSVMVSAV